MAMTKQDVVNALLKGRPASPREKAVAFAPANIALCKYWGKRNEELNLPVTSSLSISLGPLGSDVEIALTEGCDHVELNGEKLDNEASFAKRLFDFLDLFRIETSTCFKVIARNTIPTAAGFASSASGFASLVIALNDLFGWELDKKSLSILARLGSGSASRSLYPGFVEWYRGEKDDGMDSFAEPLDAVWPELRMALLVISGDVKKVGSRPAMKQTLETSPLYTAWPQKVAHDLKELKSAIQTKDFELLGQTAESNALTMHATMIAAWPSIIYWLPESIHAVREIIALRENGLPIYLTMDAGPNIKLIFLEKDTDTVKSLFPDIQIIAPFGE